MESHFPEDGVTGKKGFQQNQMDKTRDHLSAREEGWAESMGLFGFGGDAGGMKAVELEGRDRKNKTERGGKKRDRRGQNAVQKHNTAKWNTPKGKGERK